MTDSYTPKNILLTGGAGFIGSNAVVHFVTKYPQYKIINYDKLDYCSSLANVDEVADRKNYKFIKGNILSSDLVMHILQVEEIDTVIHFAAQTHVDNSFGNSFQFTENNIRGTHVLLEAAKAYGKIKRFIHVSTDEVYGEAGSEGNEAEEHTESTLLKPTNPYAATKAGAEFLVQAYHRSFNIPTIITRGNNVYGPRQYPEKLIPKFICLLAKGKPCCIHGNGNNKRSFIYVQDTVNAFDIILHKGHIGQIYNIGTSEEQSNLQVAQNLIKIFGLQDKEKDYITYVENRLFNDFRYGMSSDKLRNLGWKQEVGWEEGLKKTVDWYLNNVVNGKKVWWEGYESALVPHPRRVSDMI
jgi:dTDP-glucose 4,6-dehydratase